MSEEKLNGRIELSVAQLEDRIGTRINGEMPNYKTIRSPKELVEVRKICVMREQELHAIVSHIPLREDNSVLPYRDSEIEISLTEPKCFGIGQTFVLNRKLIELMTQMPQRLFSGFCYKGFSSLPPMEIYGLDAQGRETIALYIPPIVEYRDSEGVLLDGIHRSFICKGIGAPINAIHVYNPCAALPFTPINWRGCINAEEKPAKNDRYQNLRPELFRDLTAVGIDG